MSNPLSIQELCDRIGCAESDLGKLCETNPDLERIVLDAVNFELHEIGAQIREVEQQYQQNQNQ